MTVRSRSLLAAALGLCLAHPLYGQEPAKLAVERGPGPLPTVQPTANQQLANTIAAQLRQSGRLRNYSIDVAVVGSAVELRGTVTDQTQREEAVRRTQAVPGVERVVDHITLATAGEPITRVQAEPTPPIAEPLLEAQKPPAGGGAGPDAPKPPPGGGAGASEVPPLQPVPGGARPPAGGNIAEPMPVFQAPAPGPYDVNDPKMPPYAWPTYAPYNNYSRVAYPLAYPYNAWPYIGPQYPFPKIPLGWRSVKLQWQDGYWWFSRTATKYDWWRVRYY